MKNDKKNINITKDFLRRKNLLKNELKIIIIKSLLQNKMITNIIRLKLRFMLTKSFKKNSRSSIKSNCCLLSGKSKTVFKASTLSRHITKNRADLGLLQNFRVK